MIPKSLVWLALLSLLLPLAAGDLLLADDCQAENVRLKARVQELEAREVESKITAAAECPPCVEADDLEPEGSPEWYRTVILAVLCVGLAALAAGLTMGLVSLDVMEMEIIASAEMKDMGTAGARAKLKDDQKAARLVMPLLKNHHRLLVTLLLMNSVANEALPLFLDKLVPAWLAVLLSVTLVLIFGEILPSAIFTGSNQLAIAAKFALIVKFCQTVLAPIAMPIAWVLDKALGEDHKGRYNFAELRAVVSIHTRMQQDASQAVFKSHDVAGLGVITTEKEHHFGPDSMVTFTGSDLIPAISEKLHTGVTYHLEPCDPADGGYNTNKTFRIFSDCERAPNDLIIFKAGELTSGIFKLEHRDEIKIMDNLMNMTHLTVEQSGSMVALSNVTMLEGKQKLDFSTISKGHSRIPVYEGHPHNVRGFLLVKRLILSFGQEDQKANSRDVKEMDIVRLVAIPPDMKLLDLLRTFQVKKRHLALVTSNPAAVEAAWEGNEQVPPDIWMMGIITLEDVIEKLVGGIDDESDSIREGSTTRDFNVQLMRQTTMARSRQPSNADDLKEPLLQKKGSSAR